MKLKGQKPPEPPPATNSADRQPRTLSHPDSTTRTAAADRSAPTATDPRFRASQAASRALAQAAHAATETTRVQNSRFLIQQSKRPNRAASESKRRGRLLEAFPKNLSKSVPSGSRSPKAGFPGATSTLAKNAEPRQRFFFDALRSRASRTPQPAWRTGRAPVDPGTHRSPAVADRSANPILTAPRPSSPP